ncbi:MAG TPA: EscU/YscU/HrcU family type III secretion system export apparatus switch protein, partial [Planctomycetota bacterium]|nr:EscU/YscU/HrcU family type III secretion system export apparatus switch protein [Planctomycetota bacterium]
ADVPKADVVVTNPTELAVALRYEAGVMNAPRVVAKGQRLMARRIREIAEENHVPLVERKPLAQALFRMCEVGDEVPVDLYQAVAEVLAFVYELNRMKTRARSSVA